MDDSPTARPAPPPLPSPTGAVATVQAYTDARPRAPPPPSSSTPSKLHTQSQPATTTAYKFPHSHSFRPMYTLQPNPMTREAQFRKWSSIILSYCAYHALFTLALPSSLDSPLFRNETLKRRFREHDVRALVTWMSSDAGGRRAEWRGQSSHSGVAAGIGGHGSAGEVGERTFYVFWKRPEEWADAIYAWIEDTGQKGAVLTVWEMLEGEATAGEKWHGMERDLFERVVKVLVKRGKAQMFGEEEARGIKFF